MPKGNLPTVLNTANRNKCHEPKPVERKPEGCKRVNARINFFENIFIDKPCQTQPLQRVFLHSVYQSDLSRSQHRLLNFIEEGLKESKDSVEQMKKLLK